MTDFEQAVIGSILLTNGKAMDRLNLTPQDFEDPSHTVIYTKLVEMKLQRVPIDPISLGQRVPKLVSYLHDCISATPTPNSIDYYAKMVLENATRRKIITTSTLMASKAKTNGVDEAIEMAKTEIDNLANRATATKVSYVDEELIPYLDELDKPKNFTMSPWKPLNKVINGFRPGALYIIGARPGVGKTVAGLQIAWELSKTGPVSFHSLEMGKTELYNRIIAMECEVYLGSIEKREISDFQWAKIANKIKSIQHKLAIHDQSGQTVMQIRSLAKAVQDGGGLQAIVVDYLGLIQDTVPGRKRYESITDISIALKNLARDLNVPVIALAQLNRGPEQRKDSEPDMADLRDSGGIEQDADVVILLHRVSIEGDLDWQKSQMIVNVAKNRHGITEKFGLRFDGHFAKLVEQVS
jgi:replicative DNA helicase